VRSDCGREHDAAEEQSHPGVGGRACDREQHADGLVAGLCCFELGRDALEVAG
jgi:hypothetical protein